MEEVSEDLWLTAMPLTDAPHVVDEIRARCDAWIQARPHSELPHAGALGRALLHPASGLAEVEGRHPRIAELLLALVNLPFNSLPGRVTRLVDAADRAPALARFAFAADLAFRYVHDNAAEAIWKRGLSLAAIAPSIAGLAGIDPKEAALAAALHDFGRIVLAAAGRLDSPPLWPATRDAADMLHAEMGAKLLAHHGASAELAGGVRHHHCPQAPIGHRPGARLAHVLSLSELILDAHRARKCFDPAEQTSVIALGLSSATVSMLKEHVPALLRAAD